MDLSKKIIPFTMFALISSPQMYEVTRSLLGAWVATTEGTPKMAGLLLHALVFVILTHFVWRAVYGPKKDSQSCGCSA